MLFNSISFLMFFPVVTVLYFLLPHKLRWFLLLVASSIFYMAFIPWYILILGLLIIIDYYCGIYIERTKGPQRKVYLIISIISTSSMLFLFKYFNFFNENISLLASFLHWNYPVGILKLALPIGLSFHTFQSLSYVIEVYRGRQKAEHHFGIYALYVMFFPQLVAGPIERPQKLLHQFYEKHDFNYEKVVSGLRLILWGLFKKVVIADRLAPFVGQVYGNPSDFYGVSLIMATIYFTFQIYCDFSGYSDIAVGTARVLGFNLTNNFNLPYYSKSVSEFWRRWHISLSSWLRDYIFTPIAFKRRNLGKLGIAYALLVTFLLAGLWHGANWTFIIFGALHGIILAIEFLTSSFRKKVSKRIPPWIYDTSGIIYTFIFWSFSLIFFRAKNLNDALYVVSHLLTGVQNYLIVNLLNIAHTGSGKLTPFLLGQHREEFIIVVLAIFLMELVHFLKRKHGGIGIFLNTKPIFFRWSVYYALIFIILFWGVFTKTPFIYFQF